MNEILARIRFWRDHRWAPDRMSDYLDGDVTPSGRTRMERHVGDCAECRRLIADLGRIVNALHRLPTAEYGVDPAQLAGSVRLRLRETPAPPA
jgi:anti-sigma factor RsiW